MINTWDILNLFATTLAGTPEVDAWCQTNFSKDATIYLGFDVREPPGEESAPFIVLHPGPAQEGDEERQFSYVVMVDWGIVAETTDNSGGVNSLTGLRLADEFGRIILNALRGANDNISLSSWTYSVEPVEFFPLILAGMVLTINIPHLIGGEISL